VGEITESGARGKSKGVLSGAAQTVADAFEHARGEGQTESKPGSRRTTSRSRKEETE
jgi:hypothetical protein